MFGKWSNMAHDKIYFPEKKSFYLVKLNKGSGEYSKIISERMKGTTILVCPGDYIVCTVGLYEIQLYCTGTHTYSNIYLGVPLVHHHFLWLSARIEKVYST